MKRINIKYLKNKNTITETLKYVVANKPSQRTLKSM